MQTIIWDWNGTLLNDLDLCISSINSLLEKRKLKTLNASIYKDVFSFPVKDYYAAIGFDFNREDFAVPAREFIDLYNQGVTGCGLHAEALSVLNYFQSVGKRQFVLSAMKQDMLLATLKHQKIVNLFEGIYGLDDHYAVSKIERGRQMISNLGIEKENAVIIGDTIHDYEVAQELGIACILVSNGHQSEKRLQSTGVPIVADLEALLKNELID